MAMEVNSVYGSYASNYTSVGRKQLATERIDSSSTEVSADVKETRKTAADELSYLSKKYEGYSFISANYRQGMRYGSNSIVNVAISPEFLNKMGNNPDLEEKYEKEIANMKACDERKVRNIEGQGDRIIAKGWAIDKDGNISSWTIGERGGNCSKVTSPNEYGEKIRKEKAAKKKRNQEIEKKKKDTIEKKKALEEKLEKVREDRKDVEREKLSDEANNGIKIGSGVDLRI